MLLRLTPHLAVRTPWRWARPRPGERHLVVRGSRSFPPTHPSTLLTLELLAHTCQNALPPRVLDLGCGSGVLALAAALLGVPYIVGADISLPALATCRANAAVNGLDHAVHWLQGSTEALAGTFDLILANLPFAVHMEKTRELTRLAPPAGRLILAGFRDTQEEDLLAAHRHSGWQLRHRLARHRWEIEIPSEGSYTWVAVLLDRLPPNPSSQSRQELL